MKKKQVGLSGLEYHNQLFACINCIYDKACAVHLPFPLELSECCERYVKADYRG